MKELKDILIELISLGEIAYAIDIARTHCVEKSAIRIAIVCGRYNSHLIDCREGKISENLLKITYNKIVGSFAKIVSDSIFKVSDFDLSVYKNTLEVKRKRLRKLQKSARRMSVDLDILDLTTKMIPTAWNILKETENLDSFNGSLELYNAIAYRAKNLAHAVDSVVNEKMD